MCAESGHAQFIHIKFH